MTSHREVVLIFATMHIASKLGDGGAVALFAAQPAAATDRVWHRLLIALVRFRAWLMGSVYTAGAAAVVVSDGQLLLVKPWYRSGWGLPGGFMKAGEQAADAAKREVQEETGLRIDVSEIHLVYVQPNRRHIDHIFVVSLASSGYDDLAAAGEIIDAGWFKPDALPPLQWEAQEALRRLSCL